MKERPILFSPTMALAVREDRKGQTRRIVKPQPDGPTLSLASTASNPAPRAIALKDGMYSIFCPYGQVGDRLYVREEYYQMGHWEPVAGATTKGGRSKWAFIPDGQPMFETSGKFWAGRPWDQAMARETALYKRLARFMPRKYSRTTVEITGIRVERLNTITGEECIKEGMPDPEGATIGEAKGWYANLWDAINGEGAWDLNPFVWVVEFRRTEGGAAS